MQALPLEQHHSAIVEAVTARLFARKTSAFRRMGEDACRAQVEAAVGALRDDLESGKRDAVRAAVQALVEGLADANLTFADLRFFALTLREVLRSAVEAEPADLRLRVDDWCFELVLVCTMHFTIQREELLQKRSMKLELHQLESQLAELKAALGEKTRLLEMIRQASTPIAPVVEGIVVVPLVGMFDAFRAELLTEKLLHECSRLRARAVILDISGVPVFDTHAAQLIIRLAHAVRLLGTELILVGMSPETARTIIDLGIDLTHLKTLATLQDGLAQALLRQRLRIVPVAGKSQGVS
jgi:anti-anti-sigma factor